MWAEGRRTMAVIDVQNLEGKKVGQMELADAVFASGVNPHLLHEAVRWYLAGQRAGTHKTKGRGEVSGAGRKRREVTISSWPAAISKASAWFRRRRSVLTT